MQLCQKWKGLPVTVQKKFQQVRYQEEFIDIIINYSWGLPWSILLCGVKYTYTEDGDVMTQMD